MEKEKTYQYKEDFLFRKRLHTITSGGIRTTEDSFLQSKDTFTTFDQLGYYVQYQSDLKLRDVVSCLIMIFLGVMGLLNNSKGDIIFAVSAILVITALYWIIRVLFNLEYVGSFYFSHTTTKPDNSLEIKSKYPATKELDDFIAQIRNKQQIEAQNNVFNYIDPSSKFEFYEAEAKRLKAVFGIDDEEFDVWLENLRNKYKSLTTREEG